MIYLLDTDICIFWLKGNKNIAKKIDKLLETGNSINLSFITLSELYYGAFKSEKVKENLEAIDKLKKTTIVLDSNPEIAEKFGKLKAMLEEVGKRLDDADIFIASIALVDKIVLVTNNTKHFSRIKELKVENWM